jgi:hypothetical protein
MYIREQLEGMLTIKRTGVTFNIQSSYGGRFMHFVVEDFGQRTCRGKLGCQNRG